MGELEISLPPDMSSAGIWEVERGITDKHRRNNMLVCSPPPENLHLPAHSVEIIPPFTIEREMDDRLRVRQTDGETDRWTER